MSRKLLIAALPLLLFSLLLTSCDAITGVSGPPDATDLAALGLGQTEISNWIEEGWVVVATAGEAAAVSGMPLLLPPDNIPDGFIMVGGYQISKMAAAAPAAGETDPELTAATVSFINEELESVIGLVQFSQNPGTEGAEHIEIGGRPVELTIASAINSDDTVFYSWFSRGVWYGLLGYPNTPEFSQDLESMVLSLFY